MAARAALLALAVHGVDGGVCDQACGPDGGMKGRACTFAAECDLDCACLRDAASGVSVDEGRADIAPHPARFHSWVPTSWVAAKDSAE
jgi:hypothetical protein